MKWDYVEAGILHIKKLVSFGGFQINLHRITGRDHVNVFHSHPAKAIRILLKGGYIEEVPKGRYSDYDYWHCGRIGFIEPQFVHRIAHVEDNGSWTLWIRWPITHKIKLFNRIGGELTQVAEVSSPGVLK
jgi:hypothetical protein